MSYSAAVVEVLADDVFTAWYYALEDRDREAVYRAVGVLEQAGTALGFPQSSALQGTTYPLRELRMQSGGRPLRVFYAFDPSRQAVLLLGGDKTGDGRFYETFVPRAERIWEAYLARAFPGKESKK